jgi:hypothetical protein
MTTCPSNSITTFPARTSITITPETYTSAIQPLSFEFQWHPRTTHPNFLTSNNGLLDDSESSSVRYNGKTYNLELVQFTDPTHKNWIVPSNSQIQNYEDIILTFNSGSLGSQVSEYLVIVIPILRVVQASDPPYLAAFGTAGATQNISLKDLIPSATNSTFAYYSTCSSGIGLNTPLTNILNVISVDGLKVTDLTMVRIKTIFTNSTTNTTYGGYVTPTGIHYSPTPYTITTPEQFKLYVNATNNILVPPGAGANPVVPNVVDSTDAYKCVPFDPEKQALDGKIVIDPHNGKVLTQVFKDRDALKQDSANLGTITADIYTKYLSKVLAHFFTVIIIVVIIFVCITGTVGTSAVGHGGGYFQRTYRSLTNVPTYLIVGVLCGFTGFMMAMVLKHAR